MDAYEVVSYLNQVYGLGDSLDETGVCGVYKLTNGDHTTREAIRLELSQFLLYIGSGNGMYSDGEVALLNLVLGEEYEAYQYRQLSASVDAPNAANSLSLMGFLSGDMALNQQNGTRSTTTTDTLINLFKAFGELMVAFDENPTAKARCAKHISGMKAYVMKNI